MKNISQEEYEEAVESYQGFCINCQTITGESVEGDATGYECPDCRLPKLMGMEEALLLGEVVLS